MRVPSESSDNNDTSGEVPVLLERASTRNSKYRDDGPVDEVPLERSDFSGGFCAEEDSLPQSTIK